jgi:hypothetical protein
MPIGLWALGKEGLELGAYFMPKLNMFASLVSGFPQTDEN